MPKLFLTVLRCYFIIKLYYFRLAICYEMIDSVFELSIKPYWFLSSIQTQQLLIHYIQCNLDIKLVFSAFKISNLFGVKDPVPDGLRSHVVQKFVRAGCNACYIGETCQQFSTCAREHLVSDRASHFFRHLHDSAHCGPLCSAGSFYVLDHTTTSFQLKIKEAIHTQREQPSLNQQLHHVNLKLSF